MAIGAALAELRHHLPLEGQAELRIWVGPSALPDWTCTPPVPGATLVFDSTDPSCDDSDHLRFLDFLRAARDRLDDLF